MTNANPLVSAIIPTRNRPQVLLKAVESALTQHYPNMEVIVVIDGEDPATVEALTGVVDQRLQVISMKEPVGGSEARNVGARASSGEWIAFLDDDDEWLPEKIEVQMNAARTTSARFPLLCSQVFARSGRGDLIWPEMAPKEPLSEYLIVRNRLAYGEGLMQTSTLVVPRELVLLIPFSKGLPKHQDWDWVLRCAAHPDVEVVYVERPLAIWNLDSGRVRVSKLNRWRDSLAWIHDIGDLATPRAYSSFIAFYVAPQAASDGAYSEFAPLIAEMYKRGSARPLDLAVYLSAWLLPQPLKKYWRSRR